MNALVLTFLSVTALALVAVPRRWAPLPFITAACYLSITQIVEIGPLSFTVIRILIAVGFVRVIVRGERLVGGMNRLDWAVLLYAIWGCASSVFRDDVLAAFIFRAGFIYNTAGIYLLLRVFCTSIDDVVRLSLGTAVVLLPVGIEMLYETTGAPSLFYLMEGTRLELFIREGRVRAMGPFLHPITAGTVGAVCIPLMISAWRRRRRTAFAGLMASVGMVIASASSGPILSTIAAVGALSLWPFRRLRKLFQALIIIGYVLLALVMKAPVYYLMARIDLAGGSTGWHRSRVIESAITFLDEWWLAGTDYTRHWAPSAGWSENHTDITNHYLYIGVLGGLPLMLLFIGVLATAFSTVGHALRRGTTFSPQQQFVLWALGSALFAHTVTFLSVSYFDQSFLFLYLTLAAIGSARATGAVAVVRGERVPSKPRYSAHKSVPATLPPRRQMPLRPTVANARDAAHSIRGTRATSQLARSS